MKCLSELYSERGLFAVVDGVTVNKTEIFQWSGKRPEEELRAYAQLTSRIGMELTGLRVPVTGTKAENAITLCVDNSCEPNQFVLRIREGGLLVKAADWQTIARAAEYLSIRYPELNGAESFRTMREQLGEDVVEAIFDAHTLCARMVRAASGVCAGLTETTWSEGAQLPTHKNVEKYFPLNEDVRIEWSSLWTEDVESALRIFLRNAMEGFRAVRNYVVESDNAAKRRIRIRRGGGEIQLNDAETTFSIDADGLAPLAEGYLWRMQQYKDIRADGWQRDLEATLSGENEVGQVISCALMGEGTTPAVLTTKGWSAALTDRSRMRTWLERRTGRSIRLQCTNDPKSVKGWFFEAPWEGEDFLAAIERAVIPALKRGDRVEIEGILSEAADVRAALERRVADRLVECGAEVESVKIYRAYKSGASWIEESVIPALKNTGSKPARIDIAFRYFVNEYGEDTFEDESAPNYGRHEDKPHKWFDIPIRWLQELFPVDEVIERELGISRDAVTFTRVDTPEHTYRFTAYAEDGTLLYEDSFDAAYRQKHYIERYPQIGVTHVSTGRLRATVNGRRLVEERIETDPEKVWAFLEGRLLPELEEYYTSELGVENLVARQPLFNRLQFDLSFSEMDHDIGIRQERISTPEAMQEDIYFYILDWFKTFGERECGKELDNVGLILPMIHNRKEERTSLRVTLSVDAAEESGFMVGDTVESLRSADSRLVPLSVDFHDGAHLSVGVETERAYERARALQQLVACGAVQYPASEPFTLSLICAEGTIDIPIERYCWKPSGMTREEREEILRYKVVDYRTYLRLLGDYAQDPRLRVLPVGTSYQGRKIFALELIRRSDEICYSRCKLANSRITAYFNARHHGNEASGLNSAFLLLDAILEEERYRELPDKLNIVTLPYENIDGGEMHCEICCENPSWLAHVARYNSAGFEFRKDFSNPDTKYGEARVEMELWRKWLFDIVTDNHGFEGHELTQPFSGYISPWYKSFWIPRALYYGYIWYSSKQPHIEAYGSRVRDAVARAVNQDEEIRSLNLVCAERFEKYAKAWFPELFASPSYQDVVFYWMDTAVRKRANNFAVTYPDITVIDWTTEVADETATGENFFMNVRAHLISDLALLDVIRDTPLVYETSTSQDHRIRIRRKPLTTGAEE